ncbi:MAG: transposase [Nitrospirae bacterium]|nr:transposase [Nitrospirota bacterium]
MTVCELRPKCTRNKNGRTIKRHIQQDEVDQMRAIANTALSKKDIKTRQHLMERSFARSKRYGFDRARWRRFGKDPTRHAAISMIQSIKDRKLYTKLARFLRLVFINTIQESAVPKNYCTD